MKATSSLLLTVIISLFLISCQSANTADSLETKKGMVKVTLLYANGEGKTFDMDYYENKHMPMVADLLGESMKFFKIDKGIAGRTPDDAVPYFAIGYLYFDKLSDYEEVFPSHAAQIVGDIPNYTNIQPTVQISEIVK